MSKRGRKTLSKCAPNYADGTISCFTRDVLFKISELYNKNHNGDNQIDIRQSDNKRQIWYKIQRSLEQACGDDETCWLNQPFLSQSRAGMDLESFFKPIAPLGQYQWLSTKDISAVMKQYTKKHSDFTFFGPFPMDFMNLDYRDILKFRSPNTLQNPKNQIIGVIFNMDPSTMNGSHWVSMVIKKPSREILYFDSYGDKFNFNNTYNIKWTDSYGRKPSNNSKIPMPPPVQKYISEINKQLNGRVKANTIQHQYANSECGIYSMLFILKSLKYNFEKIAQDIILDEEVNKYRDIFFRRS
jgi:hypothetical protein